MYININYYIFKCRKKPIFIKKIALFLVPPSAIPNDRMVTEILMERGELQLNMGSKPLDGGAL
jgi:hypothetical protein